MASGSVEQQFLRKLARDLSVCTAGELNDRWGTKERQAAAVLYRGTWDELVAHHNPFYYIAEQVFFDNVKDDPAFLYPPLHRDKLCATVQNYYLQPAGEDNGLLILIQRDAFKSTFMHGVVPLTIALREKALNERDVRMLLMHQKELQASANLQRLKQKLLNHRWLRETWPEICADKDFGTKTDFNWPFTAGGVYSESSVMASGITADLTGLHFDHIFFSDLVIKDHRTSKVLRDDTAMRYDSFVYTLDTKTGKRWHDGTPYHVNDLWAKCKKSNSYKILEVPAMDDDGNLSHPHRHSALYLENLRKDEIARNGNDDFFNLQMLLRTKAGTALVTDPSWLKTCRQEEVPETTWRCILVDPAWKGTRNAYEGDYASIQVWAFERRGSLVLKYLMDGVHSNALTDEDGKSEIFRLMRKYGVIDVAPEERGGYSFRTGLRAAAVKRGTFINVIDLETMQMGKLQRIVSFLGSCQRGEVFLCDEMDPGLRASFLSQFEDFPQTDHDDALDAAGYTSDPAIMKSYAPVFNTWAQGEQFRRAPEEEMRTRYCAL